MEYPSNPELLNYTNFTSLIVDGRILTIDNNNNNTESKNYLIVLGRMDNEVLPSNIPRLSDQTFLPGLYWTRVFNLI